MLSEIRHQDAATRFLQRVVAGTLVSPLLLVGPSGIGKRYSLLCMMREILCTGTRASNCPCAGCYQVLRNLHSDIHIITAVKHIEVKEIRALIAATSNCPSASKFSVFIIDGADRFTIEAADALLKTLEEPPATSRFFLLAEDVSRVPATIRSRCGAVVYRPLPDDFILSIVQRSEEDPAKALVYSRMGEGSAGNAVDYCSTGKLSVRDHVVKAILASMEKDFASMFSLVDSMKNDLESAAKFMEQVIHDVLISQLDPMRVINVDVVESLVAMGVKVPAPVWIKLARKVSALRCNASKVSLNLTFQFKTMLAESFV
jgi:DNA polymerase-3 subunit delta'